MGACIDRYSLRRSCSCWYRRRFSRNTAVATPLVAAVGLAAGTVGGVVEAMLSAEVTPAPVLRRVHPRADTLPVLLHGAFLLVVQPPRVDSIVLAVRGFEPTV